MELITERLLLREYRERDWYAVLDYQQDPRYLRHHPWTERTPAEVREFVSQFTGWAWERPRSKYQLAVTLRETGALIGSCGIRCEEAGDPEAELGYEIDPRHWGVGYATEAGRAMVEWGFRELGLEHIRGECLAENAASANVLLKLGMRQAERHRDDRHFKGAWHDVLIFGISRDEWRRAKTGSRDPAIEEG